MKKNILIIVALFIGGISSQAQINDSLVAHYLLDGNGNDAAGNNHGTVNGPIPTIDRCGNLNSAYSFDGVNDWINIGATTDLNITGDITVSAWVKTPVSWPATYRDPMIYARYSSPGTNGVNLWLDNPHLNSRAFGFIIKVGSSSWGSDFATTSTVLQLDTWYFVTGVREGNSVKVYLNGILEGTDIGSSAPINYGLNAIATIGEKGAAPAIWYDGVIDDLRVYKRGLDANEVQILFGNPCLSPSGIDTITVCDSLIWIDGNTYYTNNNTATFNIVDGAANMSDSLVTLDLTIFNSSTNTDTQTACDSYTWIDGNTYTTSNNIATQTFTNAVGCDSIVTLNLTINNSSTGIDTQSTCISYSWIDGNTLYFIKQHCYSCINECCRM